MSGLPSVNGSSEPTRLETNQQNNWVPLTTLNTSTSTMHACTLPDTGIISKSHQAKLNWWNKPMQPILLSVEQIHQQMNGHDITKDFKNHKNTETLNSTMLSSATKEHQLPYCNLNTQFNNISLSNGSADNIPTIFQNPEVLSNHNYNEDERVSQDSKLLIDDCKPCVGILNPNEEDEMKITGYRRSKLRTFLCWLCICLTGGILRLVLHWWRHWYLIATHTLCPLDEAESVLIQESYQGKHEVYYVKKVLKLGDKAVDNNTSKCKNKKDDDGTVANQCDDSNCYLSVHFSSAQFKAYKTARVFTCKQLRYAWDNQSQSFTRINGLDTNISSEYYHLQKGLNKYEQRARRLVYGQNEITVPYKDVKTLLFLEALNPFYVFQLFSVVLWFAYNYYYYACVIVLMSVFGITMSIRQTKKNQDSLRETVQNTGTALVVNDRGEVNEVSTQELVPGDIIEIPATGCTLQCDAVLLTGNCILDESMLTGESVPITKTPLPAKRDIIFDKKDHARHTLFCGTKIIQTRNIGSKNVLAMVINTGNITAKGGLIRSILYPPPVDYKFEQDSYKFIECLALIALVGFVYTLVTKIMRGIDPVKIAVESLDLITIVVPPALPAAMTVGRYYAQKRLEKNNIYCISPRSINVAGSINCCCFDKTGTLTEDGLDMWGVVPKSATNQFQIPIKDIDRLPYDNFLFGMVTCHSISIMNGKLMGDPLDLKMFESTGWILEDTKDIPDMQKYGLMHPTVVRQPKKDSSSTNAFAKTERQNSVDDLLADAGLFDAASKNDHGIVREFPFTSNLQRMSVITRRLSEKNFNVYCKGSPEMLQQLCQPCSLPENYSQQLSIYAKQGYRVIALAYKALSKKMNYTKAQRLPREYFESELEFLGFVVMENRLKPDTTDVIHSLTAANVRTVMVTGDNILTALSVARDCGIVTHSQSVITVNARPLNDTGCLHSSYTHDKYELYYTLEIGAKTPKAVEKNGKDFKDYTCYSLNGEVASLSSASVTLPYSNSVTSVKTCDTWTHTDIEIDNGNSINFNVSNCEHWRKDYRFAMVGKTWEIARHHFPDQLKYFLARGSVFARMSPEQKQELIIELQNLDYCVAMCGDGANDCGALKVAHTGISLSETESSIASPFTSRNPTIASVPNVIKEGRAALVTSFGIFKYMAAYSMVQFISVMILYSIDSNLTDKQYLYIDLGLISVFAFFFGKTESYDGNLVKQVPLSSLISATPLSSIFLHLMVVIVFQVAGWIQVHEQPWFIPFKLSDEDHLGCFENYTMFAISSFQYIILAFVFSKSKPYRKPIWSNLPFCISLVINVIIVIYLVVYPSTWVADFFQLVMPLTMEFRYWMLIYGAAAFIIHIFVEYVVVEFLIFSKFQAPRDRNFKTCKQKYLHIENDLQYLSNWPPISEIYEAFKNTGESEVVPSYSNMKAEQAFELPKDNAFAGFFEIPHTSNN